MSTHPPNQLTSPSPHTPPIHITTNLPSRLPACLPACLPTYLPTYLLTYPPTYLTFHIYTMCVVEKETLKQERSKVQSVKTNAVILFCLWNPISTIDLVTEIRFFNRPK
jgi:hypothetical protein